VPTGREALVKSLGHEWPRYLGYFVSFATVLPLSHDTVLRPGSPAERVAVVLFGLNLTLAAFMVYRVIRYAARTPGMAADDVAEEELQAFARERRRKSTSW